MKYRSLAAGVLAAALLCGSAGAVSLEQIQSVMPKIDLYVHDDTSNLAKISPSDMQAFLDGQALSVETLEPSDQGIFYVFMLDISRSIRENYLQAAKDAVMKTFQQMGQEDQLALISFGDDVNILLQGGESASQVRETLEGLHSTDNNTRFYNAMNTLVETASRQTDMRRVAVVVSDGVDDTDAGMTQEELEDVLRDSGIAVYALAVDSAPEATREAFREFIQVSGGEQFIYSPDTADAKLSELLERIDQIWHVALLTDNNLADGEVHNLSVQFGDQVTLETEVRLQNWVKDEKPPYPVSVETNSQQKTITIQFSEAMANADDPNCYVLKNVDGKSAEFSILSCDRTSVVLYCANLSDPAEWAIDLSGLTDASMEANPLVSCSLPLTKGLEGTDDGKLAPQKESGSSKILLIAGGAVAAVIAAVAALFLGMRRKAAPLAKPSTGKKVPNDAKNARKKNPGGVTFYFESEGTPKDPNAKK